MNVFDLEARITLDASSYEAGMKKASKTAKSSASSISSTAGSMASAMGKIPSAAEKVAKGMETVGKSSTKAVDGLGDVDKSSEKVKQPLGEIPPLTDKVKSAFEKLCESASKQSDELDELKAKYASLYLEQGEESEEAQKVAQQITELSTTLTVNRARIEEATEAANKFDVTLDDVEDAVDDVAEATEEAAEKTNIFAEVLKANLTSQAIISGVKKLASAVYEVSEAALSGYAEQEQLTGGIKKLYGEAYQSVINNASNAYNKAQMSANSYMNNVMGFSAALIDSLNGDQQEAAKVANMILEDVADNANAFGKYTVEELALVYQNLAKGQYQTLDNLMLGFGGTKEGLQQLIDKANELNEAQGIHTEYAIDNFSDIASAIHVVQTEMSIAGTASGEAAGTIEGSTASMKAAWENLATGMADEEADMETLVSNFVDSVDAAAGNILPVVGRILTGIGEATTTGIAYLRETNDAADALITGIEDIGIVAAAMAAGFTLQKLVTGFQAAKVAVDLLTYGATEANIAQMTLNGTMTLGQVAVGLLTGKITLATAAQAAWNTVINANPLGLLITLCGTAVVAIKHLAEKSKEQTKELAGTAETAAEAAEQLAVLEQQLEETKAALAIGEATYAEYRRLGAAVDLKKEEYNELAEAEREAAQAEEEVGQVSTEVAEETISSAEIISSAAEQYAEDVQQIMSDYYNTYNSIYTALFNASTLFTEIQEATATTAEAVRTNLQGNTQFYEEYADNLNMVKNSARLAGVDIDGMLQVLSSMSTSDAAGAIAAIKEELEGLSATEAADVLQGWNDDMAAYSHAVNEVTDPLANAVSQVDEKLDEVYTSYEETVKKLDMGAEAVKAAELTMEGLKTGIDAGMSGVVTSLDSLTDTMQSHLKTKFEDFVLEIQATVAVAESDGSHKTGLGYVPFDGYIAELHKGEAVLTASEASAWRAGQDVASGGTSKGGTVKITQNIESVPQTPVELAAVTVAYFEQARWAL